MKNKLLMMMIIYLYLFVFQKPIQTRRSTPFRRRRSVGSLFRELGPYNTRRAYRMTEESFWKLHRMIYPKMKYNIMPSSSSTKTNGLIPSATRYRAPGLNLMGLTHE